jgi:hypothetical protein
MQATTATGILKDIPNCYIKIANTNYNMYIMPDISDSHTSNFSAQNGIGRSLPTYNYSNGGDRPVSWTVHLYADTQERLIYNLLFLRNLESCTYPRNSDAQFMPFVPPLILQIKCGSVLGDEPLSVVLENYSVKFPTDVQWSNDITIGGKNYGSIPYKLDVDLTFKVVYDSLYLPGQERIAVFGN